MRPASKAGIKPVMITGDHKLTAPPSAGRSGILNEGGRVLEGTEQDEMTAEELAEMIEEVSIFSRTTAEQKVRIVEALRRKGHIVAMTGDGVNDGPALRSATSASPWEGPAQGLSRRPRIW